MSAFLEHPTWLGGLALVWGVVAAMVAGGWLRRRSRARRLLGPRGRDARAGVGGDLLLLSALAAIAIALLGPRIGERELWTSGAGADVVLLLDVSKSMDARDIPPSRMVRARVAAAELIERLAPGDRVALAGFAGRGVAFTPLTPDRRAIAQMLPAVDSQLIEPGGSDLGSGLAAALPLFDAASQRPRIVLILSDGEVSPSPDDELALRAARAGVRLLAVAIGDDEGATVPDRGQPLRDDYDRVVISRRSSVVLDRLAESTDGAVWRANAWGEVDLEAVSRAVDRDLTAQTVSARSGRSRRIGIADARPFAAGAFLLLLAESLLGTTARLARSARARRRAAAIERPHRHATAAVLGLALLLALGADGGSAPILAEPASARAHALSGLELAGTGQQRLARRAFLTVAVLADDAGLRAVAHHNLGVLALDRGDLETARDQFFEALAHDPRDHQMRFNAEWTLLSLAAEDRAALASPSEVDDPPRPSPPAEPTSDGGKASADGDGSGPNQRQQESQGPIADAAHEDSGEGGTAGSASGLATPSRPLLDAEARMRWLDRVRDEPGRSMRLTSQSEEAAGGRPRRAGIRW